MKLFLVLLVLVFNCKPKQIFQAPNIKPIYSTYSISGKNLQTHTLETNLPFFGKGKLLTFVELSNSKTHSEKIDFYIIKDFDVLYKFPNVDKDKRPIFECDLEKSKVEKIEFLKVEKTQKLYFIAILDCNSKVKSILIYSQLENEFIFEEKSKFITNELFTGKENFTIETIKKYLNQNGVNHEN